MIVIYPDDVLERELTILYVPKEIIDSIMDHSNCILVKHLWWLSAYELCFKMELTPEQVELVLDQMLIIGMFFGGNIHLHRVEHCRKLLSNFDSRVKAKPKYTFFWMDDEENGEFSNWYQREFVIDDFRYFCVEQYMMAKKAKLFHDSERYTKVLRANTPKECKALGKQVTPFDSKSWDKVKYDIVKAGNKAKFEQNPDLKALLLETENSIMAEASPEDKIWGIGMDARSALQTETSEWPGQNLLGKILMELRDEFKG